MRRDNNGRWHGIDVDGLLKYVPILKGAYNGYKWYSQAGKDTYNEIFGDSGQTTRNGFGKYTYPQHGGTSGPTRAPTQAPNPTGPAYDVTPAKRPRTGSSSGRRPRLESPLTPLRPRNIHNSMRYGKRKSKTYRRRFKRGRGKLSRFSRKFRSRRRGTSGFSKRISSFLCPKLLYRVQDSGAIEGLADANRYTLNDFWTLRSLPELSVIANAALGQRSQAQLFPGLNDTLGSAGNILGDATSIYPPIAMQNAKVIIGMSKLDVHLRNRGSVAVDVNIYWCKGKQDLYAKFGIDSSSSLTQSPAGLLANLMLLGMGANKAQSGLPHDPYFNNNPFSMSLAAVNALSSKSDAISHADINGNGVNPPLSEAGFNSYYQAVGSPVVPYTNYFYTSLLARLSDNPHYKKHIKVYVGKKIRLEGGATIKFALTSKRKYKFDEAAEEPWIYSNIQRDSELKEPDTDTGNADAIAGTGNTHSKIIKKGITKFIMIKTCGQEAFSDNAITEAKDPSGTTVESLSTAGIVGHANYQLQWYARKVYSVQLQLQSATKTIYHGPGDFLSEAIKPALEGTYFQGRPWPGNAGWTYTKQIQYENTTTGVTANPDIGAA